MKKIERIKYLANECFEYAEAIEEFLTEPRPNEQLEDLSRQLINYLRYMGRELEAHADYVDYFMGIMLKLP
jgi:NTP pyrophosphatase (non-canonical NTP hydrolase)